MGNTGSTGGSAESNPPFRPGQHVANFVIVEMIGAGGMGAVFKARDQELGRTVALKTLSPRLLSDEAANSRFRQEAQSASMVEHSNVVQIYSFGIDGHTPYIAMEFLRGESLAERLSRGVLAISEAVDIILPVCSGVFAAHHRGILHRDLKPGNIFLSRAFTGVVPKVLDFGLAKLVRTDTKDARLTASGTVMGTPLYLAPEQAMDVEPDPRADQYALGVVLYECLTGHTPHEGKNPLRLFADLTAGTFLPPSTWRADLPQELERIVLRALQPRRGERFFDVRAFGRALLPFASASAQGLWTEHYEAPASVFDALEASRTDAHEAVPHTMRLGDPGEVDERWRTPTEPGDRHEAVMPAKPGATKLLPAPTRLLPAGAPAGQAMAPAGVPPSPSPSQKSGRRGKLLLALGAGLAALALLGLGAGLAGLWAERRAGEAGQGASTMPRVAPVGAPEQARDSVPAPEAPAAVPSAQPVAEPAPAPSTPPVAEPAAVAPAAPERPAKRSSKKRRAAKAKAADKDPPEIYYTPDGVPVF